MRISLKRLAFLPLALAAPSLTVPAAHAAPLDFDFSYTAPGGVSGSGTLTGTYEGLINGNKAWLITSGSGTFDDGVNSGVIDLVANPNGPANSSLTPSGLIAYDDLLFPNAGPGQYLDVDGLYFNFGGVELNLFDFLGDGFFENTGSAGTGTFAVSQVPESGSWLMLGAAWLALALALIWKSRLSGPVPDL